MQGRPPGGKHLLIHWVRRQPALVSRLIGLGICVLIAQLTFHYHPAVTLAQHARIVSVLVIWALLSAACQWGLERERWSKSMPFVWVAVDAICLTTTLWLVEAVRGPLIAAFPVLVAGAGLWFRTPVVFLAMVLSVAGYSGLLVDDYLRHGQIEKINWHVAFLVMLMLAGCAVAYQVHRTRILSRFYDNTR